MCRCAHPSSWLFPYSWHKQPCLAAPGHPSGTHELEASEGTAWSEAPCPESYKGGPTCPAATFTNAGEVIHGNFYWSTSFCAHSPETDTLSTCVEVLSGTPSGTHCPPPG